MSINQDGALKLFDEYVESESLRKHCLAVSAVMAAYAKKYGEDKDLWQAVGLLHDFDYEKYPGEHPFKGVEILREKGYPKDVLDAILGHAVYSGVKRKSQMAKCLFAVDELCGFVMACAYVRPEKLDGMKPKSVKKKMKTKSFAAQINRGEIAQGISELGVKEDEHIAFVISALNGISKDLGF